MEPMTTKSGISPAYLEELSLLSQSELIDRLLAKEEENRLSRAFAQISDTGTTDAALMWQGRNRFFNERIIPVQLKESPEDSFHTEDDTAGNRIISGDNLSVMASLLTEFKGGRQRGVDILYLDPPYNTGSDTFAYNDNYRYSKAEVKALKRKNRQTEKTVSLDDVSRHTKWINHIAPRLWQAKKLLKNTGVVIASIDEHELPRLWLLMEELFGEKNRIACLVWERARKNDAKYISEGHEYMLIWAKDKAALDARASTLSKTPLWKDGKGRWRKRKDGVDLLLTAYAEAKEEYGDDIDAIQEAINRFFAELPKDHTARRFNYRKVDEQGIYRDGGDISWPGGGGPRYDVPHPVTGQPVKVPANGWVYANAETMQKRIAEGKVRFGKNHTTAPSLIYRLDQMDEEVQTSVIQRDSRNSTDNIKRLFS